MAVLSQVKYEADDGSIHSLLLDSNRAAVAGTEPAGAVDSPIKVKVSKTNKEFGIRPRGVRLSRIIGTAPDQFKKYSFLPVLTATAYNSATFALGETVTIDSTDWTVSAKVSEDY